MKSSAGFETLERRLAKLADDGETVTFWLRDDDAVSPTPALETLLAMGRRHAAPMTLAVIPEHTDHGLADWLGLYPDAHVAVHGWSHRSYAGAGEKKQELGAHRQADVVLGELADGFDKLARLHRGRFVPLMVPPWNRIAPAVVEGLPQLGFAALSTFGPARPAPLAVLNSRVDIIDWHGNRGGRRDDDLAAEMLALIDTPEDEAAVAGGARPAIGILTHHLVHDAAAWAFLDRLFALTAAHPACRWASAKTLLGL